MGVKETVAFIGGMEETCQTMIRILAQENLRLLFVGNGKEHLEFLENLEQDGKAEIERIDCAREGCWEADIIAFTDPANIAGPVVERIREVSTQKIVLCIVSETYGLDDLCMKELEELLPNSKVVGLVVNSTQMRGTIFAVDPEALKTVSNIYERAGYTVSTFNKQKQ